MFVKTGSDGRESEKGMKKLAVIGAGAAAGVAATADVVGRTQAAGQAAAGNA